MGKYGGNHAKFGGIDGQGWRRFLKAHHPTKTAQEVSARTGISAATVEKWFRGAASPSFDAVIALAVAYGPEFLAVCMPGCRWMSEAAREARRAALGNEIAALAAERDRLMERR